MKQLRIFSLVLIVFTSCGIDNTEEEIATRKYNLFRAGYEPVYGDVTFSDLGERKVGVRIELKNTDERFDFPAHLHFGDITEVGELALRLVDVNGETGVSYTVLENVTLSNGDEFEFSMLDTFNGSVKIHLSDGIFAQYVLTYGNIGANENYQSDGVTICTGH